MLEIAQTMPLAGSETWVEQYGPIGLVAALSLAALWLGVRTYLREATERQRTLEAALAAQRASLDELNGRLVETVQRNHDETLELLADQRREADDRYQVLLDRHIALSDTARERMAELATTVATALHSLAHRKGANGSGSPGKEAP